MDTRRRKLRVANVAGLGEGAAVVGCHFRDEESDPGTTRFMFLKGDEWGHWFDVEDVVYSVTSLPRVVTHGKANVTAVTRSGRVWQLVSGGAPSELQLDVEGGYYILGGARVGTDLLCCGVQGMVFKVSETTAVRVDQGVFVPLSEHVDFVLEGIGGFSSTDIYAAGSGGKVVHWNGSTWTQEPTNVAHDLLAVCCSQSSGDVVVTGGGGLVLRREAGGEYTNLSNERLSRSPIRSVAEFGDCIYLAAADKLLSVSAAGLVEIEVEACAQFSGRFCFLSSDETYLWAAGDSTLLRFDGREWVGYPIP